jgi:hypothetical protein
MIITQDTAHFIITTIVLLFSYIVVSTICNFTQAWVTYKMGDHTPAKNGFLSLNPLDQIDPIGALCLVLFKIGWHTHVPINPKYIHKSWHKVRLACAFLSGACAHFLLFLCAFVLLILLFGPFIVEVVRFVVARHMLSYQVLATTYTSYTSVTIAIGSILISIMYLGMLFGILDSIVSGFHLSLALIPNKQTHFIKQHSFVIIFVLTCILFLFFASSLRMIMVYAVSYSGYYITKILGFV